MRRLRPGVQRPDEAGFTLLEVMTTCLLMGIIAGIAVGPWKSWQAAQSHKDTTRALVAVLRNAQVSAVAENVTYRVDIATNKATTYRVGTSTQVKQVISSDTSSVSLTGASFVDSSGVTSTSVFFYPRGSASKGSVNVVRTGRSKVYTVSVEGLTARVSYTE
jgi:prepilin-type N-terminal cleavage/methylation domain-containing protein